MRLPSRKLRNEHHHQQQQTTIRIMAFFVFSHTFAAAGGSNGRTSTPSNAYGLYENTNGTHPPLFS
jgi:hypothetical protein